MINRITGVSTWVHLARALRHAAGRVLLAFVATLVVVGGAAEAVDYFVIHHAQQTPGLIANIASAALAVGWAIAISLFVLIFEVVRVLVAGLRDAARGVEHQVTDAEQMVGGVVQSFEHRDKK